MSKNSKASSNSNTKQDELKNMHQGYTIDEIDRLIKETAHAQSDTRSYDLTDDDLWFPDLEEDGEDRVNLEQYNVPSPTAAERIIKSETYQNAEVVKDEYISPLQEEKMEKVVQLDNESIKKLKVRRRQESNGAGLQKEKVKAKKYTDSLVDIMNPNNDLLMKRNKPHIYNPQPVIENKKFIHTDDTIKTGNEKVNFPEEIRKTQAFVEPEPIKSHVGDVVNRPEEIFKKQTRFITQPVIKTMQFETINSPDDYILGDGNKYIKKPDDYVDPFERKGFDFTEFDDDDDYFEESIAEKTTPVETPYFSNFNNEVNQSGADEDEQLDGQVKLVGFEEVKPLEKIDESFAEQELLERRREKVKGFILEDHIHSKRTSPKNRERKKQQNDGHVESQGNSAKNVKTNVKTDITEGELKGQRVKKSKFRLGRLKSIHESSKAEKEEFMEFHGTKQAPQIRSYINSKRFSLFINMVALGIVTIILLWLGIGVQFGKLPEFVQPASNANTLIAINLVFTLLAGVISRDDIVSGVRNLLKGRFGKDGVITITLILAILQSLFLFSANGVEYNSLITAYSGIAVLCLFANSVSNFLKYTRIGYNFIFLNSKRSKFGVSFIEDEEDIIEFSRGAEIDDTNLAYSCETDFCTDFMQASNSKSTVDKIFSNLLPFIWIATALIFVITFAVHKSFDKALAGMLALSTVTAPVSFLISDNLFLNKISKKLRANQGMISGIEAIEKFTQTNAVVIDAKDLFPKGSTKIYGMKTFNDMRIDEAILYTSSILALSNAPLASAFEEIIEMKDSTISDVERITYEEHLGLSAWIYAHRVLVGTREMMEHHGVPMPPITVEKKYLQNDANRRPLYLAVGGKICALFVVGYFGNNDVIDQLTALEDSAISILVRTVDPNIDENLIAEFFEISPNSVKIISPVAGAIYKEKYGSKKALTPAFLVHRGGAKAFLNLINACVSYKESLSLISILQGLSVGIGFFLVAFFSIFAGMEQTGTLQILIYQIFWLIVTIIISSSRDK